MLSYAKIAIKQKQTRKLCEHRPRIIFLFAPLQAIIFEKNEEKRKRSTQTLLTRLKFRASKYSRHVVLCKKNKIQQQKNQQSGMNSAFDWCC